MQREMQGGKQADRMKQDGTQHGVQPELRRVIGFEGSRQFAEGSPSVVAAAAAEMDAGRVLVFDADTSHLVDVEVEASRQSAATSRVLPRQPDASDDSPRRGPGRPNLGVVGREVTLLPRHWDWLASRPGGASVTLRRLVEAARRAEAAGDRRRALQESAYRFMTHLAGDEPGYEEALRALFASDERAFEQHTERWPSDVRGHARALAHRAFGAGAEVAEVGEVAGEGVSRAE